MEEIVMVKLLAVTAVLVLLVVIITIAEKHKGSRKLSDKLKFKEHLGGQHAEVKFSNGITLVVLNGVHYYPVKGYTVLTQRTKNPYTSSPKLKVGDNVVTYEGLTSTELNACLQYYSELK